MADADEDLARTVAELARTLEDLEDHLAEREDRGFRPPTPRELVRFTGDVAIPGAILLLETNVRALRLLQRALRMADGRSVDRDEEAVTDRAAAASRRTLSRLDDALEDVQRAVDGEPPDDDARELLADARSLHEEVESRLAADEDEIGDEDKDEDTDRPPSADVDAELDAIKDELDDGTDESADDTDDTRGESYDADDTLGESDDADDGTDGPDG